jgi:hypothetical protein
MDTKQLRLLMPKNAQDEAAARELVALDPAELAPVIPEMLRHLKHSDSPVTEAFCQFFATHGERYVTSVLAVLARATLPEVKHVLLSRVLPSWSRDGVSECAGVLTMIVTDPHALNYDLLAIRLLVRHRLGDQEWLRKWLEFKLARTAERTQLAQQVACEIQGKLD